MNDPFALLVLFFAIVVAWFAIIVAILAVLRGGTDESRSRAHRNRAERATRGRDVAVRVRTDTGSLRQLFGADARIVEGHASPPIRGLKG